MANISLLDIEIEKLQTQLATLRRDKSNQEDEINKKDNEIKKMKSDRDKAQKEKNSALSSLEKEKRKNNDMKSRIIQERNREVRTKERPEEEAKGPSYRRI